MSLKHYDPELVTITCFGIPVDGFAEGTMATITWSEAAWKIVKGVDGTVSRSKVKGRIATLEVQLMSTSRANALLSAAHKQDLVSNGGAGVGVCGIVDGNGLSVFAGSECWIDQYPDATYGDAATPRVWKFSCVDPEQFEAGT